MTAEQKPLPQLDDGLFHFQLRNKETGEIVSRSVDVIALRLACEEAEEQHRLAKDDAGLLKPTAAFLDTLAGKLKGSVEGCTPSLAYQLWSTSGGLMDSLKKNMSEPPSSPTGTESTPPNSTEEQPLDSTSTSTE